MDREILFRGKRMGIGVWDYGNLSMRDETGRTVYYIGQNMLGYEVVPETIGQYTGLADKNGVKIFEGDIVDIICENDETGMIEWDEDTARFIVASDCFCADFDNYFGRDLEIIGNIHDNPELLGGVENG